MTSRELILAADDINTALSSLTTQLIEAHKTCKMLALVGIQRRGVDLAHRLGKLLAARLGYTIAMGSLDITLYRDDWTTLTALPTVRQTDIPFEVAAKELVLVDDVLYTGRTIRSALEALTDFGRPKRVELLTLVDRGHRELPIQADYVGLTVSTEQTDHVDVLLRETDNEDGVFLIRK